MFAACGKKTAVLSEQVAKISLEGEPSTLDPRKARALNSGVLIRMLFEGLMRTSKEGCLELALAEKVEVLEDGMKYVFHLKKTKWSNGKDLTAFDFESSWKTILDPKFPTDVAYYFYPIKNAKKAKLGEVELKDVGIHAADPLCLIVELEQKTPYFLETLTMTPFFPVHEQTALENLNWSLEASSFVSNGPFQISQWSHADQLILERNPMYWQRNVVKLDKVTFFIVSPDTGLRMFEEGKIDWMGSPLSTIPIDAITALKEEDKLQTAPFLATRFCRLNTHETVGLKENALSSIAFRRALSLSLNRSEIVKHVMKGKEQIATGLVPPEMGLREIGCFPDNDSVQAMQLLQKAEEEGVNIFSPITISYANTEINSLIAQTLQKQWEERLKISVNIEAVEPKIYFQRISKREFQIAIGSWTADFNDPINFLEVFKYKDNGTNNTNWENSEYVDLLNESELCGDLELRKQILSKAEEILMNEMPIIPIHHFSLNYVKKEALTGYMLSPQGHLDLRWASFETKNPR